MECTIAVSHPSSAVTDNIEAGWEQTITTLHTEDDREFELLYPGVNFAQCPNLLPCWAWSAYVGQSRAAGFKERNKFNFTDSE